MDRQVVLPQARPNWPAIVKVEVMSHPRGPLVTDRAVLVVDDDVALREFIQLALSEQGFRVATAADGLQAVQAALIERPAVVLMDIGIPHLNGCDLVNRLQETCLTRVPCVIMSGGQPGQEILGHPCVTGFLPKPFDLDALFDAVQRHVALAEPSLLR